MCGRLGILRVIDDLNSGRTRLLRGSVTFVPVTNPLAYNKVQRAGDRNLNRNLAPTDAPQEFEDHIANWLCPQLAAHDVLLDLHSFLAPGVPFAFMGPRNNDGPLEPFAFAEQEQALAVRPENRLRSVDALCDALGWSLRAPIPPLQTYFAPVADPVVTAEPAPPAAITARPATVAQTSSSVADGAIARPLAVEPAPEAVTATTRMDRPRRPYWVIVIVLLAASAAAIALLTRKPGSDSNVGQGAPVIAPTTMASP